MIVVIADRHQVTRTVYPKHRGGPDQARQGDG